MWDYILELLAKFLKHRDEHAIPPEAAVPGAPDEVEEDDKPTAPVVIKDEPILPPPPTVVVLRPDPPKTEPSTRGITKVGAWCGSRSLASPEKYVEFARRHNINRFDIVVNDHSKWRDPSSFNIHNMDKILRLAQVARTAGIEVHLMSWIMPHKQYIVQAANILLPLAEMAQASSIQWDAEEPWMLARKSMGYTQAAELIRESFRKLPIPMGVNGIGYASVPKLKPLADVCDYVVPQVYSTTSNGLDPKTAAPKFYKRWHNNFNKPVVMGLAAYRQKGIPGYSEAEAVQTAIDATRSIAGVDTVIYWSLYHITKNKVVAKVISGIRENKQPVA